MRIYDNKFAARSASQEKVDDLGFGWDSTRVAQDIIRLYEPHLHENSLDEKYRDQYNQTVAAIEKNLEDKALQVYAIAHGSNLPSSHFAQDPGYLAERNTIMQQFGNEVKRALRMKAELPSPQQSSVRGLAAHEMEKLALDARFSVAATEASIHRGKVYMSQQFKGLEKKDGFFSKHFGKDAKIYAAGERQPQRRRPFMACAMSLVAGGVIAGAVMNMDANDLMAKAETAASYVTSELSDLNLSLGYLDDPNSLNHAVASEDPAPSAETGAGAVGPQEASASTTSGAPTWESSRILDNKVMDAVKERLNPDQAEARPELTGKPVLPQRVAEAISFQDEDMAVTIRLTAKEETAKPLPVSMEASPLQPGPAKPADGGMSEQMALEANGSVSPDAPEAQSKMRWGGGMTGSFVEAARQTLLLYYGDREITNYVVGQKIVPLYHELSSNDGDVSYSASISPMNATGNAFKITMSEKTMSIRGGDGKPVYVQVPTPEGTKVLLDESDFGAYLDDMYHKGDENIDVSLPEFDSPSYRM